MVEEEKEVIDDGKLSDKENKLFIEALQSYRPCLRNTVQASLCTLCTSTEA